VIGTAQETNNNEDSVSKKKKAQPRAAVPHVCRNRETHVAFLSSDYPIIRCTDDPIAHTTKKLNQQSVLFRANALSAVTGSSLGAWFLCPI